MIKVGQIGIGHNHAEAKMSTIRKYPELFEVVGYAEENEEWIKKRGNLKGYEGLKRFSADELIEKCDAILIETDVWDLTKIAQKCIDAGKHIHMDKPASGALIEFKCLLDAAKRKNLVVQMGYMYRYNLAVQESIKRIKNGDLGEIYSINAEMSTDHGADYRKWLKNFSGGAMYIFGSHLVDLVVYMLGEPKRVNSFLKHSGFEGVDVGDNNLAVLEYEKALARVFVSSVEVNGWGRRQLVVTGSKGSINIMSLENPVTMTYSDRSIATCAYSDMKENVSFNNVERYDYMLRDFYDYIMGIKENPFSYEHDYLTQKVLYDIIGER